jgi:hypothetical protein
LRANTETDAYELKKMEEQVAETAQMLPNAKTRIDSALEDLKNFMSEQEGSQELVEGEDWKAAEQQLAEGTAFIETI